MFYPYSQSSQNNNKSQSSHPNLFLTFFPPRANAQIFPLQNTVSSFSSHFKPKKILPYQIPPDVLDFVFVDDNKVWMGSEISTKVVTSTMLWTAPGRLNKKKFKKIVIAYFLRTSSLGGGGMLPDFLFLFSFPCSADHERDWPPCKVSFFSGWQPIR